MFKTSNASIYVATSAKIAFLSWSSIIIYLFFITQTFLCGIVSCLLTVVIFTLFAMLISKKKKKWISNSCKWKWMIKNRQLKDWNSVYFIVLMTILTWFSLACSRGDWYLLSLFVFACFLFSCSFYYLKISGTIWNNKDIEDQILKFKGWKHTLKSAHLNLSFLIFLLIGLLVYFFVDLFVVLNNRLSYTKLAFLCIIWSLLYLLFYIWNKTKIEDWNCQFFSIIAMIYSLFLPCISASQNSLPIIMMTILPLYIIFIAYWNQLLTEKHSIKWLSINAC